VDERIVKALLAAVIIGFCVFRLSAVRAGTLPGGERWAVPFGVVAGALGGAYNTQGPALVVYGTLRSWPAEDFRATIQAHFLLTGPLIVLAHGASGLWTPVVFADYLASLPLLLLASLIGRRLNRRLAGPAFSRIIYGILLVIGMALLANVVGGVSGDW
ncbi:MAG: TSUP family transporter, partial [Planctomycetaceae bacterium]